MDLARAVAGRQATTVPAALERMEAVTAALPERDGIARFNHLYHRVTSEIRDRLAEKTYFADNRFLRTLDVAFANRYFAALKAWTNTSGSVPKAWKPLFERRERTTVTPIQFAAAGVNTHINFDLALALVDTWDKLPRPADDAVQRADYDKVTDIFGDLYEEFRATLLPEVFAEVVDKGKVRVAMNLASHVVVDKARDAAWASAEMIYSTRHVLPVASAWYVGQLAATTSRAGQLILVDVT